MSEKTVSTPGRMLLRNVRIAFAQGVFEPQKVDDDSAPRYGASFLLPKNDPQVEEIKKRIRIVATEKWKSKADEILAVLEKKDKTALHDGNDKPKYDGYPGNFYVSAAAKPDAAPTILNQDRTPFVEGKGMKRIYSGCYVNVSVEFWPQDNKYGQRVNATLRGVQFAKDGDSFSAARPADSNEFEDVQDGADASEFA